MRIHYAVFLTAVTMMAVIDSAQALLKCATGWGSEQQEVPENRINDGYCDCPVDGADEPETEACAGHEYWAGVNREGQEETPVFVCPQQSKLRLSLSRLNDGICDCCEGADEAHASTECSDRCDELLAEERAAAARRLQSFQVGATKRAKELEAFATALQETEGKLAQAQKEMNGVEKELERVRELQAASREKLLEDRLATVQNVVVAASSSLSLQGLSSDELGWVLVHACQVAGEMLGNRKKRNRKKDDSVCEPLRLAGLDASVMWETDSGPAKVVGEDPAVEDRKLLAEILDYNLLVSDDDQNEMVYSSDGLERLKSVLRSRNKKKNKKRRLTEEDFDDDYYDEEDEYDQYLSEEYEEDGDGEAPPPDGGSEEDDPTKKLLTLIKEQSFSKKRVAALEREQKLMDSVIALIDKEDEDESSEEEGNEKEETDDSPIDPMALPMIKNQLERNVNSISRGFDYALSAKQLLDELWALLALDDPENLEGGDGNPAEYNRLLPSLVIGTLYRSNLSVLHLWDILAHVLPELKTDDEVAEESCVAPFSCPARPVERNSVAIPSADVCKAVEALCTQELGQLSETACAASATTDIPSDVPNGFAGYYWIEPRSEEDLLETLLQDLALLDNEEKRADLASYEEELEKLEDEKTKVEDSIEELNDLVSGGADSKYGPDGELYALKDSCHAIEAGKYIYEVCLFGGAKQKEGKDSRGTDLGNWAGSTVDEDGGRVWKWENGAKCWNGPQRSATVHVTCGQEHKLISSDEPEICKYVFEMESYIACDEDYRQRHDLYH